MISDFAHRPFFFDPFGTVKDKLEIHNKHPRTLGIIFESMAKKAGLPYLATGLSEQASILIPKVYTDRETAQAYKQALVLGGQVALASALEVFLLLENQEKPVLQGALKQFADHPVPDTLVLPDDESLFTEMHIYAGRQPAELPELNEIRGILTNNNFFTSELLDPDTEKSAVLGGFAVTAVHLHDLAIGDILMSTMDEYLRNL